MPPEPRHLRGSGFTLIELLAVLAIVAMATGLLTQSRPTRAPDAQSALRQITDTLRLARARAIAENRIVAVALPPPPAPFALSLAAANAVAPDGSARGGPITLARDTATWRIAIVPRTGRVRSANAP